MTFSDLQAAAFTGAATPVVVDTALAINAQNVFAFADRAAATATDAPIVSFSILAADSGLPVVIRGLPSSSSSSSSSSQIAIRIPHGARAAADASLCRFWNETELAWSTDGCVRSADSVTPNTTVCVCTHLTSFNVAKVLVPPVNAISAADIANFFNWNNIRAHPVPVTCIGAVVALWIVASALVLSCTPERCAAACVCGNVGRGSGGRGSSSGGVLSRISLNDDGNDDDDADAESPVKSAASHSSSSSSSFSPFAWLHAALCAFPHDAFPPSTLPPAALFAHRMADLPDVQSDAERAATLGWLRDPRIWTLFRERV